MINQLVTVTANLATREEMTTTGTGEGEGEGEFEDKNDNNKVAEIPSKKYVKKILSVTSKRCALYL